MDACFESRMKVWKGGRSWSLMRQACPHASQHSRDLPLNIALDTPLRITVHSLRAWWAETYAW